MIFYDDQGRMMLGGALLRLGRFFEYVTVNGIAKFFTIYFNNIC